MKLLHDGAGVAGELGAVPFRARETRRREGRKRERRLAESSLGYIVRRDERPFSFSGRARSMATIFEIYRGRKVHGVSVEEII